MTLVDIECILGNAVEKVIGQDNEWVPYGAWGEGLPGMNKIQFAILLAIEAGKVEMTTLHKGLQPRVGLPIVKSLLGKVGHHIFYRDILQDRAGKELQEFLEEMEGKATRPGPEFYDINRLAVVKGDRPSLTISEESQHYFGIRIGDEGVAGDIMWHGPLTPCFDALLLEEISLHVPQHRLGQSLILF